MPARFRLTAVLCVPYPMEEACERLSAVCSGRREVKRFGLRLLPFEGAVWDDNFYLSRPDRSNPPNLTGRLHSSNKGTELLIEADSDGGSHSLIANLLFALLMPTLIMVVMATTEHSLLAIWVGLVCAVVVAGMTLVRHLVWVESQPEAFRWEIKDLAFMLDATIVEVSTVKVAGKRGGGVGRRRDF